MAKSRDLPRWVVRDYLWPYGAVVALTLGIAGFVFAKPMQRLA